MSGLLVTMGLVASLALFGANQNTMPDDSNLANQKQADCDKLRQDPFPDLIVEQVLTKKGIASSQIKEINGKLDQAATTITDKFLEEYQEDEEPVATNDPLSEVYNTDNVEDVKRDVFMDVMKAYITDAQVGVEMFNQISAKRESALEACTGTAK